MASADLSGKTVLLTGATRGIGRVACRALAGLGAAVVFVGRDAARIADTQAWVQAAHPGAQVTGLQADLSLVSETVRVARTLRETHDRLDVLVHNAGAVFAARALTSEGFERTFALNHLSPFVLTRELLPLLKQTGTAASPARVVTTASRAHRRAKIDLSDLQGLRRPYADFQVYSDTKMMNVLFTFELAQRLQGSSVTATCLHPGVIASGFAQGLGGRYGWLFKLARPWLLSPEQGADTLIHLASSPAVQGVSGKYFDRRREVPTVGMSNDVAAASRLWAATEALLAPQAG
jgi:NAD(P)-dependent dehydrogenase (short-subunit alcohol dehydrogenase family)